LDSIDETKIRTALASRLERGGAANYKYPQESIRCCDIFSLVRIADKWSQPKDLAHVPNLSGSSIQNQTGADKARIMAEHMFPRYSEMTVPPETLPTMDEFLSRGAHVAVLGTASRGAVRLAARYHRPCEWDGRTCL